MSMANTIYSSERSTFWQLITKTKIEIPIIQRDYAQGRKDKTIIRNNFLGALFRALADNNSIELDFIYGNKQDNCLQPLDGQQRLTTLFLLHWYVACKENQLEENKEILKKFTYETRSSSREFCNEIIERGIDLNNLLPVDKDEKGNSLDNQISKTIIDASWFFLSWKKDPTIYAMLNMLDAIHYHDDLKDKKGIWAKLTVENRITFLHIPLKDFGLSDDLYIKMNARGKPLTQFENFKAIIEKKIVSENWESEIPNHVDKFAHKIDTDWTDLFWKFRDKNNFIDNTFIRFINATLLCSLALRNERNENRIRELFNNPGDIKPLDFNKVDFVYLKQVLNIYYSMRENKILAQIPFWQYLEAENKNFFELAINEQNLTYPQRVLLYAQTEFLIENGDTEQTKFNEWMRVVRNIVHNATIDSAETFTGAIGLISELSKGNKSIYDYLSNHKIQSRFAAIQTNEEVLKAQLILKSTENKKAIFNTEDTNFFKGKISFALYCIDYEKTENNFDEKKLSGIQKVVIDYLNDNDISNDFRRGLMTIKDNNFYDYWTSSWLFAVDAPKRCLIENISELRDYSYMQHFRDYLKEIILELTTLKLSDLLSNYVISKDIPNWKQKIITEKDLLDFSKQHYIAIAKDNSCCWLIPQSKVANSIEGANKLKIIR